MLRRAVSVMSTHLRSIVVDGQGSILPIFAILITLVIVLAGAGIDYARAINARTAIGHALDAAALSVARQMSTSVMTDEQIVQALEDAFDANMSAGNHNFDIGDLDYTVDPETGTISVTTTASVATQFIHAGGIGPQKLDVATASEVKYSSFDVEMALVVDVTGSMSGEIADLREAAEGVVDILIPEGTVDGRVRVSVVPYSVGVNLGSYAAIVSDGYSSKCGTEREGPEKYTDAAYNYTIVDPEFFGGGSGTYRYDDCSDSKLLPLSSDRDELLSNISGLMTEGYTAGQTGIQWGWYTLSPNWTGLWPSESAPAAYNDDESLKFALIMTDGAFNTYYDKKTWSYNKCQNQKNKGKYTGTCYSGTNEYWVEKSSSGYGGKSSKRARDLCAAMKASDITLYTVYFGTSSSSDGAKVMQDCATDQDTTYFQATDGEALVNAFAKIANEIQKVYISK